MIQIITDNEFERNIFELKLHGIGNKEITDIRNNYKRQSKSEKEVLKEEKIGLKNMGFFTGKKNKTKVINR